MHRKGEQLEKWAEENIKGVLTKNSGATFRDADMKVGGVGGRLYEFKSSEANNGLAIRRDHLHILLQRAVKLSRDPVFIVQNAKHERYAVMPSQVLTRAIEKWIVCGVVNNRVKELQFNLQCCPVITSKGNNIRIKEEELFAIPFSSRVLAYRTKNRINWVILDAELWLEVSTDRKTREQKDV